MCETSIFENSYVSGIIGSFLASFLTIFTLKFFDFYRQKIKHAKFKKIFGSYENDKLNLVLPVFTVRHDVLNTLKSARIPAPEFPLRKYTGDYIRTSKLLAQNDNTALKYLQFIISSTLGDKSVIMTDEDLSAQLDISFISFGGSSFYFKFVLDDADNNFYELNNNHFINKRDKTKSYTSNNEFDFGLILKYKHINFPTRTWIIIAGLSETGTSGAGWYLFKHWEKLSETVGEKPFALIIQVKHGVDESARQVDLLH